MRRNIKNEVEKFSNNGCVPLLTLNVVGIFKSSMFFKTFPLSDKLIMFFDFIRYEISVRFSDLI